MQQTWMPYQLGIEKKDAGVSQSTTAEEKNKNLFKLHDSLWSTGWVQRKDVMWCINFRLFLYISGSRNNLLMVHAMASN